MNRYTEEVCKFWEKYQSHYVKVNKRKLAVLAKKLLKAQPAAPDWQIPGVLPKSPIAFVSQIFYICAVDFAFTHFEPPHEKFMLNDKISGSMAASACFYRRFGEKPVRAQEMMEIASSPEKTKEFFQGINLPPLIEERRKNLYEAAKIVKMFFKGGPMDILKKTDFTVAKIIDLLITSFPASFGSDYCLLPYNPNSRRILFLNKRAQLWPLIYQGRALYSNEDEELPLLKDVENIGPISDYQLPKYLRSVGVLEYTPLLDEKIEKQELILSNSPEEIEIRCATVYAVRQLMEKSGLTMPSLDYFLWSEGRKMENLKHHLTPTTAY